MIVYTVKSVSMLCEDVREFTSERQMLYWVNVLIRNKIQYTLRFRRERGPRQLEFKF